MTWWQGRGAYLCLEALICHLLKAGLKLLQESLTAALQLLTGEGSGLQNERHTASTHSCVSICMSQYGCRYLSRT